MSSAKFYVNQCYKKYLQEYEDQYINIAFTSKNW
jgi:hypothetical protein